MTSKRDLYQSYQFMMQRLISGLVLRESDPLQSPLRRMIGSAFGSVMIAILALAVAGVIGLVKPGGNSSWKEEGKVIVEEETGAQYVWLPDKAGVYHLHPVPNIGSGALLVGTAETVSVSRNSLADAPRGVMLGIPGTVNSLPDPKNVVGLPWTLCSLPAETVSGVLVPNTALAVGQAPTSGTPIGDNAMLLRDIETDLLYLVWNSHRYLIPDQQAGLTALSLGTATQIRVGTAWLTSLPTGKDLAPVTPPGSGSPSAAVSGYTVGTVVRSASATGDASYVVQQDGLLPVSAVEAALTEQLTGPASVVDPQVIASVPVLDAPQPDPADLPAEMPEVVTPGSADSTVCAEFGDNPATPEISLEAGVEGAQNAPASPKVEAGGTVLADRVLIAPGTGAVVRSMSSPDDRNGPLFIVTDDGTRYAIPSKDILATLGLKSVKPILLPASLIDRVPQGAALDPEAAKVPI